MACPGCLLQDDSCLIHQRIRLQRNDPVLPRSPHGIRNRDRESDNAYLRGARFDELVQPARCSRPARTCFWPTRTRRRVGIRLIDRPMGVT